MTTVVNTFGFNGSALSHQPTTHKWIDDREMGVSGDGHAVYPAVREYELTWDFLSAAEFNEIYTHFLSIGVTGSVVANLPQYASSPYQFYAYSGCLLRKPMYNGFFENYYEGVKLLIVRIHV